MNKITWLALAAALSAGQASAAVNFCGELKNHFGPYDYRDTTEAANMELVTSTHYTEEMMAGLIGHTGPIGADLDYTLRAIPNHPGALALMARVGVNNKTPKVVGARWAVECYFDRAIRFQSNDGAVRAAYGNYLFAMTRYKEALEMYKTAGELTPDDSAINYNLGLAYLKLKDYDNAQLYAKKAYALGFPLPGLKNLLVAAGKWTDTPE